MRSSVKKNAGGDRHRDDDEQTPPKASDDQTRMVMLATIAPKADDGALRVIGVSGTYAQAQRPVQKPFQDSG